MSTLALILFWLLVWVALHFYGYALIVAGLEALGFFDTAFVLKRAYGSMTWRKQTYFRKIVRAHVYYLGAAISGTWMLYLHGGYPWREFFSDEHGPNTVEATRARQVVVELFVYAWGGEAMRIAFSAAFAHWVVSIFEDTIGWQCVLQWSRDDDQRAKISRGAIHNLACVMYWSYILHHGAAIVVFGYTLYTHQLSSLCCLALAFEAPVILTNIREFCVVFDEDIREYSGVSFFAYAGPRGVAQCWQATVPLVIFGRFSSMVVYEWSLLYWRPEIASFPVATQWLYHLCGCTFTLINYMWTVILMSWYRLDVARARRFCKLEAIAAAQAQGRG